MTGSGPNQMELDKIFPAGATVALTLAAGGSGVSGSLYADAELPTA